MNIAASQRLHGIRNETGFPGGCEAFCYDRLAVVHHNEGIQKLQWYGPRTENTFFFRDGSHPHDGLFKFFVEVDHRRYPIKAMQTRVYPFGFVNRFRIPGLATEFEQRFFLLPDCIAVAITALQPLEKPVRAGWSLNRKSLTHWNKGKRKLLPVSQCDGGEILIDIEEHHDNNKSKRPVHQIAHAVEHESTGDGLEEVHTCIVSACNQSLRHQRGFRELVLTENATTEFPLYFVLALDHDPAAATSKAKDFLSSPERHLEEQVTRFAAVESTSPRLDSSRAGLQLLFDQTPAYLEAAKVHDIPGAIRARDVHYWVWGWDSWIYGRAHLYAGDTEFVKDLIRLHAARATEKYGLIHSFDRQMNIGIRTPWPAQGMFISLVYDYFAFTGDKALVEEVFPLIKSIAARILDLEDPKTGIPVEWALFPDKPEEVGQTGHDLTTFNTGFWYGALCGMDYLAGMMNDAIAKRCRSAASRIEENFVRIFQDAETGTLVDSVDAESGEARRCFPLWAHTWAYQFEHDIVAAAATDAIAAFIDQHQVTREMGNLILPCWDRCWGGNVQFGCWWSFFDAMVLRILCAAGRSDAADRWFDCVEHCMKYRYVPEGAHAYDAVEEPYPDMPGSWFTAGAKAWYIGLIESLVGVRVDAGGITVSPADLPPTGISGLRWGRRSFSVKTTGAGPYIECLRVDGPRVDGTLKLPSALNDFDILEIVRSSTPPESPILLSASHAAVGEIQSRTHSLEFSLSGHSRTTVRLYTPSRPAITVDGKDQEFEWDPNHCTATIRVELSGNAPTTIAALLREETK